MAAEDLLSISIGHVSSRYKTLSHCSYNLSRSMISRSDTEDYTLSLVACRSLILLFLIPLSEMYGAYKCSSSILLLLDKCEEEAAFLTLGSHYAKLSCIVKHTLTRITH